MVSIEYDMEKEMKKEEKKVSKVLKNFPETNGLEEILKETMDLYNSNTFKFYIMDVFSFHDDFVDYHKNDWDSDFLRENFYIVEYAEVLKKSKIKLLYVPSLWGDVIVFENFEVMYTFCFHLLSMKKGSIEEITLSDGFYLIEKIMSLGYNFDTNINFNPIPNDFFKRLKSIKWDKRANKLFEKIYSIHGDMLSYIIAKPLSSFFTDSVSTNRFILTFLVACNAVNDGRDRMVVGDVVLAFKTFYKLFDASIDDLI